MSTIRSVCLHRLLPAALLAVAATLGGSAIGDPATACGKPSKNFDRAAYERCASRMDEYYFEGAATDAEYVGGLKSCCKIYGGDWGPTNGIDHCRTPKEMQSPPEVVGRPGVTPPQDAATQAPPPAPIVTVTPPPANPG